MNRWTYGNRRRCVTKPVNVSHTAPLKNVQYLQLIEMHNYSGCHCQWLWASSSAHAQGVNMWAEAWSSEPWKSVEQPSKVLNCLHRVKKKYTSRILVWFCRVWCSRLETPHLELYPLGWCDKMDFVCLIIVILICIVMSSLNRFFNVELCIYYPYQCSM